MANVKMMMLIMGIMHVNNSWTLQTQERLPHMPPRPCVHHTLHSSTNKVNDGVVPLQTDRS